MLSYQRKYITITPDAEMEIIQVANPTQIAMHLLLEADPSEVLVKGYISGGAVFNAVLNGEVVATYVLTEPEPQVKEIKNIAVAHTHRGGGIGTRLLKHAIEQASKAGAKSIMICTGNSSIQQLSLYQKAGFRIRGVVPDFFTDNYPEPIWENGLQCRDLVVLSLLLG